MHTKAAKKFESTAPRNEVRGGQLLLEASPRHDFASADRKFAWGNHNFWKKLHLLKSS